jgi:hypothetical protein
MVNCHICGETTRTADYCMSFQCRPDLYVPPINTDRIELDESQYIACARCGTRHIHAGQYLCPGILCECGEIYRKNQSKPHACSITEKEND